MKKMQVGKQTLWLRQAFWWLVFLWLAVVLSALAVVYVTYDTRVKFNVVEGLRLEQSQLQVIWGQYLLEESTWASYGRVEKLAQEHLFMQAPTSEKIITVVSGED